MATQATRQRTRQMAEALDQIELSAGQHAIEVANFAIFFATPLDQTDMRRFTDGQSSVAKLFPAIHPPNSLQLPLPPIGHVAPQAVEVIHPAELLLFGGDGRPTWTGQFGGNAIHVSCRAYTDWKQVWPAAEKRLTCLARLVDPHRLVSAVDYSVTDTFHADTKAQVLLASEIFEKTRFVPSCLNDYQDPRWDFSHAWFESVDGFGAVLVRVGGRGVLQGTKTSVSIDNTHSYRLAEAVEVSSLLGESGKGAASHSRLAQIFERFHDRNKALLREILKDRLLARMRLHNA